MRHDIYVSLAVGLGRLRRALFMVEHWTGRAQAWAWVNSRPPLPACAFDDSGDGWCFNHEESCGVWPYPEPQ